MTYEQAEQYVAACSGCKQIVAPSHVRQMNHLGLMHDTTKGGCGSGRVCYVKMGNVAAFFHNQGGV